jgi:hypothetical protein
MENKDARDFVLTKDAKRNVKGMFANAQRAMERGDIEDAERILDDLKLQLKQLHAVREGEE